MKPVTLRKVLKSNCETQLGRFPGQQNICCQTTKLAANYMYNAEMSCHMNEAFVCASPWSECSSDSH